jgi:hypothetical protein
MIFDRAVRARIKPQQQKNPRLAGAIARAEQNPISITPGPRESVTK